MRRLPQCHGQLIAKKQNLDFAPVARLEQFGEGQLKGMEDRKYCFSWFVHSAPEAELGRIEFSEGKIVYVAGIRAE